MAKKLLSVTTFDSHEAFEIDAEQVVGLIENVGATVVQLNDGTVYLVDEAPWIIQSAVQELTGRVIESE